MLLRKYKTKYRYTMQELAEAFDVSRPTMHSWVANGATIRGKVGHRIITLPGPEKRELAREAA